MKSSPFEVVKTILQGFPKAFRTVYISDMPNEFILIRCENEYTKQQLLFGYPWILNGLTLQLVPWQSYFEPAFTKLTRAMVWIQLHNLPVEFLDGDSLESLTKPIGRLLKVNEYTSSLSQNSVC